jgi:hypothetical protein
MRREPVWGPSNPHPLSKMKTELVWEGKYDEYGNRREVDIARLAMPMQRVESIDQPRSEAAAQGSTGVLIQSFRVEYPAGPDNPLNSVHMLAQGTGHDANHVTQVRLYLDNNADGQLDAGDRLLASGAFATNNGTLGFNLSAEQPFQAPETRHYLVVYDFNLDAPHGATFRCLVTGLFGFRTGTVIIGLPAPSNQGTAGVVMNGNLLRFTLNGPQAAVTVNADSQGPTGDGELLADVTVSADVAAWTLSELTFTAQGTADMQAAFSELALYEDNGNGSWDGAAVDSPAAPPLAGFDGALEAAFTLNTPDVAIGTPRRFYLVGKLSGAALPGQTLNARLSAATAASAMQGLTAGLPTVGSTALVIDTAVLTVTAGPEMPETSTHVARQAFMHVLAQFILRASNEAITVSGLTFNTGGTGDWQSALDANNGVQVWRDGGGSDPGDPGDGVFEPAVDTLLYEGPGGAQVQAAFTAPLTLPVWSSARLWVVLNTTTNAGIGAAAAVETYTARIAATGDVDAGAAKVVFGTPAPQSNALQLLDFFVTTFDPLESHPVGGVAITIEGSGFLEPFEVRIGGEVCPGTLEIVNAIRVTGLSVPAGAAARGIPIEISSGPLPTQTLTQTFRYKRLRDDKDDSGCSTGKRGSSAWLILLAPIAPLAVLIVPRRRD